ncbi:MAG: hypothetical protein ABSF03_17865 [Streptosporangiaceae bacterium]
MHRAVVARSGDETGAAASLMATGTGAGSEARRDAGYAIATTDPPDAAGSGVPSRAGSGVP